ncbi:hypothetical protein, partial [Streptomyces galilaeus]|uniref:hypothetical protein n=1 Tax=Streptomyces galilaeus TaxID=33899 RepID=UPI0038F6206F
AIRYVDSISGSGTTSENRFNLPSSFGGKRAKLVIGLYTMAALDAEGTRLKINQTDVRLPSFTIPLDNSYNAVETSIFQSLSGAFYPVRAN